MAAPKESDRKEAAKELLLADHGYFTELFLKNEQIGETRVNWFIGIVTGSIGGLVALATKGELTPLLLRVVIIGSLFALLAFGVVTLFRIITRNRNTDGYKKDLDSLRQIFQDYFDPEGVLTDYHPLGPPPGIVKTTQSGKENGDKSRMFGGLTHTVAAINALIAGALFGLVIHMILTTEGEVRSAQPLLVSLGATLLMVAVSFLSQWYLIEEREREAKKELRKGRVTHAGGVVFGRSTANAVLYLLVRPSKGEDQWVLPKGKVEKRENHGEAGLREVFEETGVRARIIHFLSTVEYLTDQPVKAKFYLMERVFETKSSEGRETIWLPYDEALDRLGHAESKYLLTLAELARSN
jgi:8-oxo-dGTP pyrophosphatase MutT (NUDIX family)